MNAYVVQQRLPSSPRSTVAEYARANPSILNFLPHYGISDLDPGMRVRIYSKRSYARATRPQHAKPPVCLRVWIGYVK